ncbi:MAG: class I SAM-dependent methyltransferase [Puia sp.]|nr:class I SAM-dependent methyltransferase [Puia sp.]
MFDFHADRRKYFDMQVSSTEKYVIPFIEGIFPIEAGTRVLEIGCGEGGVLKPFVDRGCRCIGIDLDPARIEHATAWLSAYLRENRIRFVTKDIYLAAAEIGEALDEISGTTCAASHEARWPSPLFDIIILKDTIEHIPDPSRLLALLKTFLQPDGVIFFGFPPWQMPFGGHQQLCSNKWLSLLPYYHLLPLGLYKAILRLFKEPVKDLLEIRETGLSIEDFERITRKNDYTIVSKLHYLVNPIYEWKFGWKPRRQWPVIRDIPFLRNFVTSCVYYLITY